MTITCQVVTKPMRNVLRARNAHVIGLLRAYYVPHVTRYVSPPRNSHVIAHVIDLVWGARTHLSGEQVDGEVDELGVALDQALETLLLEELQAVLL